MSSIGAVEDVGLRSVLIASDFSEASHKALHHALAIARHFGAKFYFAHVVSHIGYTIAGPEALQLAVEKTGRDAAQLERELLESGALAGLRHEFIVREGDVWQQLEVVIKQKEVAGGHRYTRPRKSREAAARVHSGTDLSSRKLFCRYGRSRFLQRFPGREN